MTKKIIIISIAVILLVGLAVGGYFFWKSQRGTVSSVNKAIEKAGEVTQKMIEGATMGALPSVVVNPLESKPNVNPVDKTNAFKDIKTNPFK